MQQSGRDRSVFRSLALSFGEGLAFSVGMTLTQSAVRRNGAIAETEPAAGPDLAPVVERLAQLEKRMRTVERPAPPVVNFDQKVIHAIVSTLETRLQEHSGQIEQRLDDLEARIAANVQAGVAARIEEETAALRAQVVDMHREFAEAVARIVAEQVAARAAAIQEAVEQRLDAAVAPLRADLEELRRRVAETDDTIAEFVSAISGLCRDAAARGAAEPAPAPAPGVPKADPLAPEAPEAVAPEAAAPVLSAAASAPAGMSDLPVPAFAQSRKPHGFWRIPLASSFLLVCTAAGLLLR